MQLDIQLDARPDAAAARARELAGTGVDGLFTFEGPHDVFLPLTVAAGTVETDLLTNVAIALPRSPMHLAHTAYDLQLISRGRFRLGLGSQVRPHIENRYGATWDRPAARMREIVLAVKAILQSWQDGTRLDFRGEFTRHTLMPPTFVPGPNPYGVPPVLMGALGPVMTRTAAEVEGWENVQPELNRLSKSGNYAAMVDLVTDEMLDALAVRGTPEECAAEIRRRFGSTADRVCAYFPGYDAPLDQVGDLAAALHAVPS